MKKATACLLRFISAPHSRFHCWHIEAVATRTVPPAECCLTSIEGFRQATSNKLGAKACIRFSELRKNAYIKCLQIEYLLENICSTSPIVWIRLKLRYTHSRKREIL